MATKTPNVTVRFRPNHPKENGELVNAPRPILVEVYSKNFRLELSTGIKVYPANFVSGRATSKEKDFKNINTELSRIETEILGLVGTGPSSNGPRVDLKDQIRAAVRGEVIEQFEKKTVDAWIERFIIDASVKESTKQVYRSTLTHLKGYAEKFQITLTWESFDLNFHGAFTDYLYTVVESDNTVGKIIKTVKTFLSESFERDQHTNLSFKKKGFKVYRAPVDEIYLTESEIGKFGATEVSPSLIAGRDLFVFACEVGLRYGDLQRLTPHNLVATMDGFRLDVTTLKTGEDVKIALSETAKALWDAWEGRPPRILNPVFNRQIKAIAEKAGLTELTQKRKTVKGRVKIEWVPKFKMVTAHTARRSFATNSYNQGLHIDTIMSITGHKTEKTFKKYIRTTKEQHAARMQKHLVEENKLKIAQ